MPLALLKKLTALRHTSGLALLGVVYLLFLVLFYFGQSPVVPIDREADPAQAFKFDTKAFSTFSVFVFAFTCHQNLFPVYNEAINNSRPRMIIVISLCIGISAGLYLVMGNLGYITFGSSISSNILNNYGKSTATTLGQFLYMLLTVLSYPLQSHPCRASLEKLIPFTDSQRKNHAKLIYYGLSFGIIICSFFVAVFVSGKTGLVDSI